MYKVYRKEIEQTDEGGEWEGGGDELKLGGIGSDYIEIICWQLKQLKTDQNSHAARYSPLRNFGQNQIFFDFTLRNSPPQNSKFFV